MQTKFLELNFDIHVQINTERLHVHIFSVQVAQFWVVLFSKTSIYYEHFNTQPCFPLVDRIELCHA